MSRRATYLLWSMIGASTVARLVVAFKTTGVYFDIDSFRVMDDALRHHGFHAYGSVDQTPPRWPYLPAYFPIILFVGVLSRGTGLAFHGLIQVPPIIADAAIAWLVQDYLGRRGAGDRMRLAAAALVALGPSFAVISGFSGQFDSFAILPAVLALWLWDRLEPGHRRALVTGALIGLGAGLKMVPGLMVLAFLPHCRSRQEVTLLLGAAVLVPLAMLAPFLVADGGAVVDTLRYKGYPGQGGISLLVQPDLAQVWLNNQSIDASAILLTVRNLQLLFVAVGVAGVVAVIARYRPTPPVAASLIWLAVFVFGVNFFLSYLPWGLPFFIAAGFVRSVAALQAFLLVPTVLRYWVFYKGFWGDEVIAAIYAVFMIGLVLAFAAALAILAIGVIQRREPLPIDI